MPRVVHFEIKSDNPEKAMEFYKEVFGWEFNSWEGPVKYWLIKTGENEPGIDGGLTAEEPKAVNTISVPSVDEYMKKIEENGGKMITEKMPIPGVGYLAYFEDSEGNKFGIMENNKDAK